MRKLMIGAFGILTLIAIPLLSLDQTVSQGVINKFQTRYDDVSKDCGDKPAYMCTGIIIRALSATNVTPRYLPWEFGNTTSSYKKKAASFSFLRADLKFGRFFKSLGSGYILAPIPDPISKSEGKPKLLCGFPIDAWTNDRGVNGGCDRTLIPMNLVPHDYFPLTSIPCVGAAYTLDMDERIEYRNITVTQLLEDGNIGNIELLARRQCGFGLATTDTAIANFKHMIATQKDIGSVRYNEIMVSLKKADSGDKYVFNQPIEAYFYLGGGLDEDDMRKSAAIYRQQYRDETRIEVPLVKITVPADGDARKIIFTLVPEEQAY